MPADRSRGKSARCDGVGKAAPKRGLPLVREAVTDENAGLRKQVPVEIRAGRKRAKRRKKKDGNRERGQKTSSEPNRERRREERREKEKSKKSGVTPHGTSTGFPSLLSRPAFLDT